jgi:Zinc-finger double-stranded RNA-binding/Zinc-finger of C2H2 type
MFALQLPDLKIKEQPSPCSPDRQAPTAAPSKLGNQSRESPPQARRKLDLDSAFAPIKKEEPESKKSLLSAFQKDETFFEAHGIERTEEWLICNLCDGKKMNSAQALEAHLQSELHRRRKRDKDFEREGIPFSSILRQGDNGWPDFVATRPRDFFCLLCDAPCSSKEAMETHLVGKKHRIKLNQHSLNQIVTNSDNAPGLPEGFHVVLKNFVCDFCYDKNKPDRDWCFFSAENYANHLHRHSRFLEKSSNQGFLDASGRLYWLSLSSGSVIFQQDLSFGYNRDISLPICQKSPLEILFLAELLNEKRIIPGLTIDERLKSLELAQNWSEEAPRFLV